MTKNNRRDMLNTKSGTGNNSNPVPDFGMVDRSYFLPFHLVMDTPKNTAITNYMTTRIILPAGRINGLWIEFPAGCAGLSGFQLWRGARQIFPVTPDIWQTGDDVFFRLAFTHILFSEPLEIIGRSYNTDDTYKHKMTVILEMSGNQSDVSDTMQSFLDTLR